MPTAPVLVHELNDQQIRELVSLYQQQWWSTTREETGIRAMLKHTSIFFALTDPDSGRLLAFCRLLTDFTYRGYLQDVMVQPDLQGSGLGKILLDAVFNEPRLAAVTSIALWCKPDLVPLYEKYGFQISAGDNPWMTRPSQAGAEEAAKLSGTSHQTI